MLSDERIRELALGSVTHPNAFVQTRLESVERAIRLAVAETAEACARECERRAEERFDEYGTRESDTGATYYTGSRADEFEAKDEEAEDCAAAIREKAREGK